MLALGIQLVVPVRVPLYDGVVVQEPYRYLHPAAGQAGEPAAFSETFVLDGGRSPTLVAATTESPPQAQLIARPDAFAVTATTTYLMVEVRPIDAPAPPPPPGVIAGNAYQVSVTDEAGTALAIKPCTGCISLVFRAPEGIGDASLQRFADGAWTNVAFDHTIGLYQVNPMALGVYALVSGSSAGPGPSAELGLDLPLVLGGAALLLLLAGGAFLLFRVKPAPPNPTSGPGRVPSKRRRPRAEPPGRSKK